MVKTSSIDKQVVELQVKISKKLTAFNEQHNAGEKTSIRIACGNTLNRLSSIIDRTATGESAEMILGVERACEQFYFEHFAITLKEIESSQKVLQSMHSVKAVIQAPLDPEQYKADMKESLGKINMSRVTKAPQDIVHTFMRSQRQRLTHGAGQICMFVPVGPAANFIE